MQTVTPKSPKKAIISYRILLTFLTFSLLSILIIGSFITKRPIEAQMDGLTKITFKIFERRRDLAISDGEKGPRNSIPDMIPSALAGRVQDSREQLAGSSILWVDDRGARQNVWERRALNSLGVSVDTATSTEEAIDLLKTGFSYDVIITDLARNNLDPTAPCYPGSTLYNNAGCAFIRQVQQLCGDDRAPIIIYSAGLNESAGQPAFSAGMTNRFDKLMDYVLDAVQRRPPAADSSDTPKICARTPLPKEVQPKKKASTGGI